MALHLSRFLKSVGDDCLRDHFEKQHPEIAATTDWASRGIELRRHLERAVSEYPAVERHPRPLLERIDALAREPGDRAMVAVCNGNAAARSRLNTLRSPQERAMWLLGHDSELFAHAEDIHYADLHSGGRSWSGFLGPVGRWPEATPDRWRILAAGSRLYSGASTAPELQSSLSHSPASQPVPNGTVARRCSSSQFSLRACHSSWPSSRVDA
jgi:hypothetical protein